MYDDGRRIVGGVCRLVKLERCPCFGWLRIEGHLRNSGTWVTKTGAKGKRRTSAGQGSGRLPGCQVYTTLAARRLRVRVRELWYHRRRLQRRG